MKIIAPKKAFKSLRRNGFKCGAIKEFSAGFVAGSDTSGSFLVMAFSWTVELLLLGSGCIFSTVIERIVVGNIWINVVWCYFWLFLLLVFLV